MARHSPRKKLAKYVYQDASGISAVVYLKGHTPAELRFPLGTPLPEIRRAQEVRMHQFEAMAPAPVRSAPDTVADVITTYVAKLGDSMHDADERGRLMPWIEACGEEDFSTLTKGRLNTIRDEWLRAGRAPGTIAKRISSFRIVARAVNDATNDDRPPHAIELIKRPRTPRSGEIRARPLDLVMRVLEHVADVGAGHVSKCKARLAVWAWTGQNPAQIQQLRPEHVRWTTSPPQLYIQPRRKGAGVDAGWIPLLPQAVTALREFFARDAAGPWNKGVVLRAFKSARNKTQRQLKREHRHHEAAQLEGMLPRDLRHSIATAMLKASGDVFGVSELLRHSDIKTTLRYTHGAASVRAQAVVAALSAEFSKKKTPTFPKEYFQKSRGLEGRNAKGRHEAPPTAKAHNGRRGYDLAGDSD